VKIVAKKMAKIHYIMSKHNKNSKRHKKHHKKYTKKMRGGDFSNEDRQELAALGFTDGDINIFQENGINNINIIRMSLQQINPETGVQFTPQEIIQSIEDTVNGADDDENESVISDIPNVENEQHNLDDENDISFNLDESFNTTRENISNNSENSDDNIFDLNNSSQGSLHLSDLNVDESNESNNTTNESLTGGKKRKIRKTRKGKKTQKNRKTRKGRKNNKSRKN